MTVRAALIRGFDKRRLRLLLALFFLALAVPAAVLILEAFSQLKWEAVHRHRELAAELTARIDSELTAVIDAEEARSFADYGFLVVSGDPASSFVQRSPLSAYPVASPIPGLIGYFQVDAEGRFSTPLLPPPGSMPQSHGISDRELDERLAQQERVQRVLSANRLVQAGSVDRDRRGARSEAGLGGVADDAQRDTKVRLETYPLSAQESASQLTAVSAAGELDDAPGNLPKSEQVPRSQVGFDELNAPPALAPRAVGKLGRVEDLKLDAPYRSKIAAARQSPAVPGEVTTLEKSARKERGALPEAPLASVPEEAAAYTAEGKAATAAQVRANTLPRATGPIRTFESEVDPFEFSRLQSGHLVLFRKVWREDQRYIQGALLEPEEFLHAVFQSAFLGTGLSRMSDLILAYDGEVVSAFSGKVPRGYLTSAEELRGALLYQTRLSAPLSHLEMIFSITRLPAGPGAGVVTWVASSLTVVLLVGFYLMYRLGARQIDLTRQQQDFVSAVSHELKTPLTSIRMYGELLREGWASEEKKRVYYDYIHEESERLSRLIGNVLQLARMTRNDTGVELRPVTVAELMDGVRSKVSSQIDRAGFVLNLSCEPRAGSVTIEVDPDRFTQIVINLVDNAIKFAAQAQTKSIDISAQRSSEGRVEIAVRDYGPGVQRDQMKKIFKLFYRSETELTRDTVGTGIGLALAHQLARTMKAEIDVVNRSPGAEFRVSFPAVGPRS